MALPQQVEHQPTQDNFDKLDQRTSKVEKFGVWTAWTPTFSGWSANPSGGIYRYTQIGKLVIATIRQPNNGTSNSASVSISLPVTATTGSTPIASGPAEVVDNGTFPTTPGLWEIGSGATGVAFYKDYSGAAFTASGNKRINSCTLTYESA